MIRIFICFVLIGALFSSGAMADMVRPEIGTGLHDALNLVETRDVKNCPAARNKLRDISLVPDQTTAEAKIIHDLGGFVTRDCDYAESHNGHFPVVTP